MTWRPSRGRLPAWRAHTTTKLAALGKQRSEMHRAQDERAAALEQLAARQLEASQAMSAAEAECEELGAEVQPGTHILINNALVQQRQVHMTLSVLYCATQLWMRMVVQVEEAIEAAAGFTTKVAQIRCVISAQQAAQELIAELRSTELVASADLQARHGCASIPSQCRSHVLIAACITRIDVQERCSIVFSPWLIWPDLHACVWFQSLEAQADAARSELREATARAAVLQVESADAHERATAARRRIPELEAKKKAAAASRVRPS